jgi:hypothetical protein
MGILACCYCLVLDLVRSMEISTIYLQVTEKQDSAQRNYVLPALSLVYIYIETIIVDYYIIDDKGSSRDSET